MIAGLGWNVWYGGFLYAGILRSSFVNPATFCVNSLAHYLSEQPYDDRRSSSDHLVTAIITIGEGYHNFHHAFCPTIEWHQPDLTKWCISLYECRGLAYSLNRFRQNEIDKTRLQQVLKKLIIKSPSVDWGPPLSKLPVMEWDEYQAKASEGQLLMLVGGTVHDVSSFIQEHPGGS